MASMAAPGPLNAGSWSPRRMPDPQVAGKPASWAGGGAGGRCGSGWALKPPAGRGGPTLAWTEGRTGLRADRASLRHARARGSTRAMLENADAIRSSWLAPPAGWPPAAVGRGICARLLLPPSSSSSTSSSSSSSSSSAHWCALILGSGRALYTFLGLVTLLLLSSRKSDCVRVVIETADFSLRATPTIRQLTAYWRPFLTGSFAATRTRGSLPPASSMPQYL